MENKKIVYNNIQYNILSSIKVGSTTFLICLDIMDKKIEYFKQEIVDGKVKLTSKDKLLLLANDVNMKSLSNKKRVLDLFVDKIENNLAKILFVDRNKVINEFKKFANEIDNCDLKYYMIENAQIEPTNESIERVIDKFNVMDLSKNLEDVKEIKNELYYFNTNEEVNKAPKEESVSNANKIEITDTIQEKNEQYNGPIFASDPFKTGKINIDDLTSSLNQTKNIENVLDNNLKENMPQKTVVVAKKKKTSPLSILLIVAALGALAVSLYFTFFNSNDKNYSTSEIMEKVNNRVVINEIEDGYNYNQPITISSLYNKALESKLIDVNVGDLKSLNNNTIGWIKNDYLNVSYPLVKGTNNNYYKSHDYLNGLSSYGWLYVDSNNNFDSNDKNIVIYGSSYLNSQFFYSLKNVLQADFVKDIDNQVIKISTDDINSSWLVFSIYEIKNEEYFAKTNFTDNNEFIKFLETINDRSVHNFGVELDENDKILTLTTDKDNENKIVVHAKLIKTDISLEQEDINVEVGAATVEEEQIEIEKGAATIEEEKIEVANQETIKNN